MLARRLHTQPIRGLRSLYHYCCRAPLPACSRSRRCRSTKADQPRILGTAYHRKIVINVTSCITILLFFTFFRNLFYTESSNHTDQQEVHHLNRITSTLLHQ